MKNVPNDRDTELGKVIFVLADGKHIEHGLGRVRMSSIASINNMYM